MVPCARISGSATLAAHGPSGAGSAARSATGVIAPIVVRAPSRETPASPAPPSMSTRSGFRYPYVISGTTIVPPARTVTPAPSPNASIASCSEVGWSTSGPVPSATLAAAIDTPDSRLTVRRV